MKKRIIVLLAAIVMLLCGCAGNKPLTAQEYSDELYRCWGEFLTATVDWTKYAPEDYPYSAEDIAGLKETVARREKALNAFAKINPPEKYADRQKALVRSLDYEYKWNKTALRLIEAKSSEEADKIGKDITEIVNSIPDGESLPRVCICSYTRI